MFGKPSKVVGVQQDVHVNVLLMLMLRYPPKVPKKEFMPGHARKTLSILQFLP